MADKVALNRQLLDTITSMEVEGLVDSRFRMVYSLKEANGPFFFAELIPTFCSDAQTTIREMTLAFIGAHQIALACGDLRHAIDDRSKERCTVAVDAIRHEFLKLHSKMDIVLQLERMIISHN
ncbi:uncharacterized protein LOC102613240 isoform X2 [Citrus sinensis]|uniref:uncharacterized protein LOC18044255 isoform X2 n=1 Tax=Citrus clementina TaxID=85681 RepID=UPI000CED5A51|nr:uncharacterized protein LOC18044255 isoform X2 [Citrus x clementina]XP_024948746.1 uncharacterized protein LOC102613240 isoform X2 [Citrus sinensis]